MATLPEKVNLADAIISIFAASNPTQIAEITCVKGEMVISKGERDFTEDECHSGTEIGTGPLKFPEGSINMIFDSADKNEAQVMLEEALAQTGDFANDHTLQMSIEFNNSKGSKGAVLDVDLIIGSGAATFPITGNATLECKYKQEGPYTLTAAT